MAIGSLLFLLLALVIAAFIGAVLWFMVKTMAAPTVEQPDFTPEGEHRNPRPRNIPACGKCGYPARGLNTFECPECGADLREVGIVTPGMRRSPIGAGCLWVVGYSVAVLILAFTLAEPLFDSVPRQLRGTRTTNLHPDSGSFRVVSFTIETEKTYTSAGRYMSDTGSVTANHQLWHDGGAPTSRVTMSFGPLHSTEQLTSIAVTIEGGPNATSSMSQSSTIVIDPSAGSFVIEQAGRSLLTGALPVSRTDVSTALVAAGVDVTTVEAQHDLDEMVAAIDGATNYQPAVTLDGFRSSTTSHGGQHVSDIAGWEMGYFGIWLALWILGLVLIARRTKRKSAH